MKAPGSAGDAAQGCAPQDAGPPAAVPPAVPTQPSVTVKPKLAKGKAPLNPRLAWTGSDFAVVWPEASREEMFSLYDEERSRWSFEDARPRLWMVRIDESSGLKGEPVVLEGAGAGPAALSGPLYSFPAWHAGRLYLAWMLWNEESKMQACRFVGKNGVKP